MLLLCEDSEGHEQNLYRFQASVSMIMEVGRSRRDENEKGRWTCIHRQESSLSFRHRYQLRKLNVNVGFIESMSISVLNSFMPCALECLQKLLMTWLWMLLIL